MLTKAKQDRLQAKGGQQPVPPGGGKGGKGKGGKGKPNFGSFSIVLEEDESDLAILGQLSTTHTVVEPDVELTHLEEDVDFEDVEMEC